MKPADICKTARLRFFPLYTLVQSFLLAHSFYKNKIDSKHCTKSNYLLSSWNQNPKIVNPTMYTVYEWNIEKINFPLFSSGLACGGKLFSTELDGAVSRRLRLSPVASQAHDWNAQTLETSWDAICFISVLAGCGWLSCRGGERGEWWFRERCRERVNEHSWWTFCVIMSP